MKHLKIAFLLVVSVASLAPLANQPLANQPLANQQRVNKDKLNAAARLIVQQFAGQLKPTLQAAIQSGGLVHAIDVCALEAPKIAADLSEQTG